MCLQNMADEVMDYLDEILIEADYNIYENVKGESNKSIEMPNAHLYGELCYTSVSFTYQYDLLVIYFLGKTVVLPFLKSSTCNDFYLKFDFEMEKVKLWNKIFNIVNKREEN